MKAKEKAEELVRHFKGRGMDGDENYASKECALIVVNEILDSLETYDTITEEHLKNEFGLDYFSCELQNMDSDFRYWWKVKEEINKL
jgi:hypothetical protein